MNKKLLIPLFAILGAGLILAASVYYVNTINLTVDVKEAFVVSYAILGDAGNYDGVTPCSSILNADWLPLANDGVFDKDGFYPMESRKVCVKIQNLGQADIPYVITSTTTGSSGCRTAFANVQKTGIATKQTSTIDGAIVTIASNAPEITDCNIKIEVGRGTLPA